MSALAIIPTGAEYQTLTEHAKNLVASGFLPSSISTPQQVIAIITLGAELKIGPWQAINGINVIQGKPTVSPQLMLALINASGELEDMKIEGDAKACTVTMKRRNRTPHTETFTMQDANAQGLAGKSNWQKMPAIMLKWRAVAACARIVFPDIIIGMYTPEEIDPAITVNTEGELVGDIVITRPEPAPAQKPAAPQIVVDGTSAREVVPTEDEQPKPAQKRAEPDLSVQKTATITEVKVLTDQNGHRYYGLMTAAGDKLSIWSRRMFIETNWIAEDDWPEENETYGPYTIPVTIARDERGFWKIVNVTPAPPKDTDPTPPARPYSDVLGTPPGRRVEKPEPSRDMPEPGTADYDAWAEDQNARVNDEADDVPDDLPEPGKAPTVFGQPVETVLKTRSEVVSAAYKFKGPGGHEYVRFVHAGDRDLSMTVNQFSKAIAGCTHASDYIDIITATGLDMTSRPWADEHLPELSVKYEMVDGKPKIISIAEFDDIPF